MARKINYDQWSKEELIKELRRIKETKYGLVWNRDLSEEKIDILINPDARTPSEMFPNEMSGKPFPILKEIKDKEINGDKGKPVNLLIEGDNYHSLAVLNFTHQKAIDLIYIDPPYNTGNNDFVYNDKFVDKEDSFRHSKWLSFMEKRLKLSRFLLKDTGAIFISIDDNEQAPLRMLCDEIFGEKNFVSQMVWKSKPQGGNDNAHIITEHEYVLVFAKDIERLEIVGRKLLNNKYKLFDEYKEIRGGHHVAKLDLSTLPYRYNLDYPIKAPDGSEIYPGQVSKKEWEERRKKKNSDYDWRWRWSEIKFDESVKKGFVVFKKGHKGYSVYSKEYEFVDNEGNLIERSAKYRTLIDAITTIDGTKDLGSFFEERVFSYPKPVNLMKMIAGLCKKNATILDYMAGSGTTGQAVLELNKEDGGKRKFILCTNNGDEKSKHRIASDVCYPRIKKIINGYKDTKSENIEGLDGNLRYYKTDFVEAEPTDKNKRKLVKESTDMLCIREDAFEMVQDGSDFKIFKNSDKYLGIIFYEEAIGDFKKAIKKIKGHFNTYVFSLGDDPHEKQFADVKDKVALCAIPEVILKVYREIFK